MTSNERPWDKNNQLLLVLIVAFNLVPHIGEVEIWVIAVSLMALAWKALYLLRGIRLPSRWPLSLAALLATAGVLLQYRTLIGQEAASALLVVLASFKLLETNRYRDGMLVIFTSYFLLMAHLLTSQSLLSTLYMGLDVLLITTLMFQLHKRDRRSSPRSFRPAMRLLAYALPVWILLFIAFPRFSASLFNLRPEPGVSTGFSDDLNPGSVEHLIESDGIAFRVTFDGNASLSPQDMYWRGGILTQSQGLRWGKKAAKHLRLETLPPEPKEKQIAYEVWLEPVFQKWLFALDYPLALQPRYDIGRNSLRRYPGFVYQADRDITTRTVYNAVSTRQSPEQTLTVDERSVYLQLPEPMDPRVLDLVKTLQAQTPKNARAESDALSAAVLNWFVHEGFRYTKSPGALKATQPSAQLSEFLFERKKGFCEHFAASYATLMRAMGVPARVTIGFQGGKYNSYGRYLLVRNLDAHSWAEIWQEGVGGKGRWVRVDPSVHIAPLRLELGGDFNLLDENTLTQGLSRDELQRGLEGRMQGLPLRASLAWDAIQMRWNSFLLAYDFDYQRDLLNRLGFKNASRWMLALGLVSGLIVLLTLIYLLLRRRSRQTDPVLLTWNRFLRDLEKLGIHKLPNEGPLAFAARASDQRPELSNQINSIAAAYAGIRYGQMSPEEELAALTDLRKSVQRFSRSLRSRTAAS